VDGKSVTITRSKSGGLSIKTDAESVTGNNVIAEEYFQQIIGISPSLFRPMLHKRQGEGGFFLGMRPQEMYDFLTECLNLDVWTQKIEKVDGDIEIRCQDLEGVGREISTLTSSLQGLIDTKASFTRPVKNYDDSQEPVLKGKLDTHRQQYNALKDEYAKARDAVPVPSVGNSTDRSKVDALNRQYTELRDLHSKQVSDRDKAINELNKKIANIDVEMAQIETKKKEQPALIQQFEEIKTHIVEARNNKCPTCKQGWEGGDRDRAFDTLVAKAKNLKAKIDDISQDSVRLTDLVEARSQHKAEIEVLKKSLDHSAMDAKLGAVLKKLKSAQDQFSNKEEYRVEQYETQNAKYRLEIAKVTETYQNALEAKSGEVSSVERALSDFLSRKSTFEQLSRQYDTNFESISTRIEDIKGSLSGVTEKYASMQKGLDTAQQAHKILKAFVNQLFQDTLKDIATRATEILKSIPNMSTASIQFEAFKETKSGNIKQQVNAVLSMDGEIGIPIKSLSGGERSSVDLAVDFAVIDMIENISGKGIDLFILDEPFTGLDAQNREECLEIIKQNLGKKRVVIVDHSAETKAMVPDKVVVIREGQTSCIKGA
jgi:DNA repair exonuclease SbcCD ATPase subunit